MRDKAETLVITVIVAREVELRRDTQQDAYP